MLRHSSVLRQDVCGALTCVGDRCHWGKGVLRWRVHACRWVTARMDFTSTALLIATVLVATGAKDLMSPTLVALALAHMLQLSGAINVRCPAPVPDT